MVGFPVWFKRAKPQASAQSVVPMSVDDRIIRLRIHMVTEYGFTTDPFYAGHHMYEYTPFTPELQEQYRKLYAVFGDIDLCLVYWKAHGWRGKLTRLEPWDTKVANAFEKFCGSGAGVSLVQVTKLFSQDHGDGIDCYAVTLDTATTLQPFRRLSSGLDMRVRAIRAHLPNWVPTHAIVSDAGRVLDLV